VENCRGCGSLLDQAHAHADGAAVGLRESARGADATRLGRECPLYQFRYRMAANRYYAEEATVVLPDGATRSVPTGDSVTQLLKGLKR
jgi:hypothetical protein